MQASNFPEMFTGPLSTTFVKTVWQFSHIDGSQIKKLPLFLEKYFRYRLQTSQKYLSDDYAHKKHDKIKKFKKIKKTQKIKKIYTSSTSSRFQRVQEV